MKKASNVMKTAVRAAKAKQRKKRQKFPYAKVAKLWIEGKSIDTIAHRIKMVDTDFEWNGRKDPYHSLRNFLYRMHKGYKDENGNIVKLPHRVSASTVKAARKAGFRAWAPKKKSAAA